MSEEVRAGYKLTEVGVIPEDWDIKPLGAFVNYTNGKAHEQSISDYGTFVVVNSKFISTEGLTLKYSQHCYCQASAGDVLMVMSDVPNGRAIAKCYFVERNNIYTVNQRICILNPREIDGKLLFYNLDRNPFYLAFDDGAKQTNLRKDDVLNCPLGVPTSEAEQRAIAAALSDVDALLEGLTRLIAKKRDLKQAAMQQLLTGQTRLPGYIGEWEVKRLGDLAEVVMGQSPSSSNYNSKGDGLPLIQGNADIANRQTIRRIFTTQITKRGKAGDILMSVRAPVGEISRATFDVCLGRGVCAIRFPNDFLYHCLIFFEPNWAKHSKGSTFDSVNSADVNAVEIQVPTDATEQSAIATILSDMDAELAALEARRDKTRALKQAMMRELLTGRTRLVSPEVAHA